MDHSLAGLGNGLSTSGWVPKLTIKVPKRGEAEPQTDSGMAVISPKYSGIEGTPVLANAAGDVRDFYAFGKELGRGHFGVVRICIDLETGEQLACKSILKANLKKKEEIEELRAEVAVMRHLAGHAHVVELVDLFEDNESVHLVMELCKDGDLFDYIARRRRLQEGDAARILWQVVLAVQHCHSRGVIHRDLKPENILFATAGDDTTEPQVKIADFGLAVIPEPGQLASGLAGSPFYMAPELVRRHKYGPQIDVWSLGVILYTALSGFLPFWGKNHEQTFAAVMKAEPDYLKKPWPAISREAKRLVRSMLHVDPRRRATLSDILSHPWMLQHNAPHGAAGSLKAIFSSHHAQPQASTAAPAPSSSPAPLPAFTAPSLSPPPLFAPSMHKPSPPLETPPFLVPTPPLSPKGSEHQGSPRTSVNLASKFTAFQPFSSSSPPSPCPSPPAHSPAWPSSPRSPRNSPTFAFGAAAKKGFYALFSSQYDKASPGRGELVMQRPLDGDEIYVEPPAQGTYSPQQPLHPNQFRSPTSGSEQTHVML